MSESHPAQAADAKPAEIVVSGSVQRIFFRNDETGFTSFVIKDRDNRPLTIIGVVTKIIEGEYATAQGRYERHKVHGEQFRARSIVTEPPVESAAIEKYLGSGTIKGIGPEMAKRLVKAFGADTFATIEHQPEALKQIQGLGKKRIAAIVAAWHQHKEVQEIMHFLSRRGLTSSRAHRIYEHYRDKPGGVIKIMQEEPYQLTEIRGIGFDFADKVAKTLGFENEDPRRLKAGIHHVLQEETKKGHCGLPYFDFLNRAAEILEASRAAVDTAILIETEAKPARIILDNIEGQTCAFTVPMHQAESEIADCLKNLAQGAHPFSGIGDVDAAIDRIEAQTGRKLSMSQRQAVRIGLSSKVAIITGGPGVGKTTTLDTLLRVIARYKGAIRLSAPTGRAAKRMGEQTGYPAVTIHRLIGAARQDEDGDEEAGDRRPKPPETDLKGCRLLVVDESSMIDVRLMASLLKAMPAEAALLIVGDIDQLPSVGAGSVLRDLIGSDAIPVARLTEIFRQAANSRIITNAHLINQGRMPVKAEKEVKTDFFIWEARDAEECRAKMLECVTRRIPSAFGYDPKTEIQVLAPMKAGPIGTAALNKEFQAAILPHPRDEDAYQAENWRFLLGDRVMQTSNNYDKEVFNGDMGFVVHLDKEAKTLTVNFDQGMVDYSFDEVDQLMPAYAVTIHKSQGSEYPAVVIPMMNAHYVMLSRNLLYTGVTRGRSLVVLIGQDAAIRRAVQNNEQSRRWTRLRQLMARDLPPLF